MRHAAAFTLTIPNNGTESNVYVLPRPGQALVDFTMFVPASLDGTITIYIGATGSGVFADMKPLYINGANVTLVADKAMPIPVGSFKQIGIKSSATESPAVVVPVIAQIDVD